jgi:signal transduction histidine kinase
MTLSAQPNGGGGTTAGADRAGRVGLILILLLPIIYLAVSGVILAAVLWESRVGALQAGKRLTQSWAQLAAEQTDDAFQSSEQILRLVSLRLNTLSAAEAADEPAVSGMLRDLLSSRQMFLSMWVIGSNGRVLYDVGGNAGMDLSDRAYFLHHVKNPDDNLEIGAPVASRATGQWLLPITGPWRSEDGGFAGVIAVALNLEHFDRVWTFDFDAKARTVALFTERGIMLMRSPMVETALGRSFAQSDVFARGLQDASRGDVESVSSIDGLRRLVSFRRLSRYPDIVVTVSETVERALAAWHDTALITVSGWLIGSATLTTLQVLLMRTWRRRWSSEANLAVTSRRLDGAIAVRDAAEQEAEDARARLLDAIQVFPGSFRLYDRDERLILTNQVFWKTEDGRLLTRKRGDTITDITREAADLELADAAVGRGEAWMRERLAEFRRGNTDAEIRWRDGRWFQLLERRTSDGGTVSLRFDITARKKIEDQLRQAQKMEAVGLLTGGIAHDFNNMLTVILSSAETVIERAGDDATQHAAGAMILRAAEGAADLTSRLLAFARQTPLQPRRVDANQFVARMHGLLRRTLGEQTDIRLAPASSVWEVVVDPAQLEAALLNLAVNARDAMPSGGQLTIETANVHVDENYAAVNQEAQTGDFVVVAVSDTGTGMSPETIRRAFEPFFTTKEVGRGTGLGLSMVYGFVRQSGGHVKIYSEPNRGTTIRMYLPRAMADVPAIEAQAATVPEPVGSGETILVVEDDELVRGHVTAQLTRLGYRVLSAEDGRAALDLLGDGASVDLLFTDVVMPGGLSGRDVADEARRLRPGLRVLFTSGYTENAIVHGGRLDADARLLSKPYRLRELAEKIRDSLAEI